MADGRCDMDPTVLKHDMRVHACITCGHCVLALSPPRQLHNFRCRLLVLLIRIYIAYNIGKPRPPQGQGPGGV